MRKFFRELMKNARNDLHQMFKRTYGLLYEQNSEIFVKLFDDLSSFYNNPISLNANNNATRKILDDAMENFYQQLYQRMFRLLNQPYQFDQTYFDCMSGKMDELKPFGDVPDKMKLQISKALVAAKIFHGGLTVGRESVRQLLSFVPSNDCHGSYMKMAFCQHCSGLPNIRPCKNFCLNVMNSCFHDQVQFDHHWNDYLGNLVQLLDRLQGPLNIESVIDPITIKISDAIMTFQDKGQEITDKIFEGCGAPRVRRNTENDRTFVLPNTADTDNHSKTNLATRSTLDQLVKDIREKVVLAKEFWKNLPDNVCNDARISKINAGKGCWNDGNNQSQEALIDKSPTISTPLLLDQIQKLNAISNLLRQTVESQAVYTSPKSPNTRQNNVNQRRKSTNSSKPVADSNIYENSGSGPIMEDGDDDEDDGDDEDYDGESSKKNTASKTSPPPTDDEDILAHSNKNAKQDDNIEEYSGYGPISSSTIEPTPPIRTPPLDLTPNLRSTETMFVVTTSHKPIFSPRETNLASVDSKFTTKNFASLSSISTPLSNATKKTFSSKTSSTKLPLFVIFESNESPATRIFSDTTTPKSQRVSSSFTFRTNKFILLSSLIVISVVL
uniref:Glypican-6 n=1 Tax=Romanomermis culicivorax TaxID=13658 RepID=A0A915J1J6_ROMCU